MGFPRPEYLSGLPCSPLGDLPDPGMEPAAAAKSLQSCPTLYDPIDGSPPGSSVPEILRIGYWSGLPFPSPIHACMLSPFSRV